MFLQSGANALDVAAGAREAMDQLQKSFPQGVSYIIPFDTTRFVQESIHEVVKTLLIAAGLVILVVFVFLQSWRATLIPMIAVPVSLIGCFAGLWLFHFSINTLTLFAIVLATGIVVDDAIVVLENVERLMAERNLSPKEAAIESMREVTGAIIAIELVLVSVFIPVAFLGGLAGKLYQQFAVTVATAVIISGIVALTLTPALCALLLKPQHKEPVLFRPFNRAFAWLTRTYLGGVNLALRQVVGSIVVFAIVIGASGLLFKVIPGSFVPSEDQGYIFGSIILPDGATLTRTGAVGAKLQKQVAENPAVEHMFVVTGFDLIGGGNKTNAATTFIPLKPWDKRKETAEDVTRDVSAKGGSLTEGIVLAFNPPPIRGLGTAGGFEVFLQDRITGDPRRLNTVLQDFMAELRKRPELTGINTFFRPTVPQILVEVDREKAIALGVPVSDIFDALQGTMGALYVNDFNKFGRTYRVQIQAEGAFRARPEDLGNIYVRSSAGDMLPLKSLLTINQIVGPEQIDRYNAFLAAKVLGNAAPGFSSGQAIAAIEDVAAKSLPNGYTIAWTGQAFQEKRIGTASIIAFTFAVIMVFLILSANYERWSLPVAVLLAVPFALLGALLAVLFRGMSNDVYFQIGLLVLIGLAAKNAILIVEFAAQEMAQGPVGARRGGRGRAAALPAHRDDVAGIRSGRGAAGPCHRSRRRVAAIDGHRRVRRHAGRDVRRYAVHPAVLRPSREASRARRRGRVAGRAAPERERLMSLHRWLVAGAAVLLAGCMVGPDYQRPAVDLPRSYPGAAARARSPCRRAQRLVDAVQRPRAQRTRRDGAREQHRRAARGRADRGSRRQPARGECHPVPGGRSQRRGGAQRLELRGCVSARAGHAKRQERHSRGAFGLVRDRLLGQVAARRGSRARPGIGHALRQGCGGPLACEPHHADVLLVALARRADCDHTQYAHDAQRRARARQASRRRRLRVRPGSAPGGRRHDGCVGAAQGTDPAAGDRRAFAGRTDRQARPRRDAREALRCSRSLRCRRPACRRHFSSAGRTCARPSRT